MSGRSKPARRRKVWALTSPMHALEGARVLPESLQDQVALHELMAIEAFRSGTATEDDWHTVVTMCNLAEHMAQQGIGPEVLPHCATLEPELIAALERHRTHGRMATTGPGLTAMREVQEYHALQRSSVARSEYERHIRATIAKLKARR